MTFCGQCGLQLAANDRRCPRCGAVVEPEVPGVGGTAPGTRKRELTLKSIFRSSPMPASQNVISPRHSERCLRWKILST